MLKPTKPNDVTIEALHTHTHTCSVSGYLTYKKIGIAAKIPYCSLKENIYKFTQFGVVWERILSEYNLLCKLHTIAVTSWA